MGSVTRKINTDDLRIYLKVENGVRIATVTHSDGFVVAQKAPVQSTALELEIRRALAELGVEPEHELAPARDTLERDRANAVRELGELKQFFHREQKLSGELSEKIAELEGERVSLASRLAGVERERSELAARVKAYDDAAREMSKMRSAEPAPASDPGASSERKTNPGGRPIRDGL